MSRERKRMVCIIRIGDNTLRGKEIGYLACKTRTSKTGRYPRCCDVCKREIPIGEFYITNKGRTQTLCENAQCVDYEPMDE